MKLTKIALGGGCHWCTEAVFQSLKGVVKVEQGYVSSVEENSSFSEAVIVHFNTEDISLKTLVEIHLHTHKSTSNHSMRSKYRSAVYTFSEAQKEELECVIEYFQKDFDYKLITKVYPFQSFKASREAIQKYYQKDPNKPFCKTFIAPKLKYLVQKFSYQINQSKVAHIATTTV
ncbi:peptide-methionine (S)-S-oxide reductase [Flavivirga spongiicola]|uniref:peptide-methionine (S)-S-oxide reductase n=1 Tax=Flavivirga spongiicola TaxID=421621 RepID=A0ABU7XRM1_9FLAO|nr:peptide-methionine (S)-S-oxide reductase [Flavivirga sp. MEBiC05379]MDO5978181.1 peptide-methionine (S)-S-oxide reductase [Flavivirga sp. MEBiC05379]